MSSRPPGPFFNVPAGTKPATCRGPSCNATIYWIKSAAKKDIPVDCDVAGGTHPSGPDVAEGFRVPGRGVSHFATCKDADYFRRKP